MNEETKRTDTGKLIDADALCDGIESQYPWIWSNIGRSLRALILSKPDASEPLRKRIAELEEQNKDLIDAIEVLGAAMVANVPFSMAEAIALSVARSRVAKSKGGQDA